MERARMVEIATRIEPVGGVVGVMLGGSRARGEHSDAESDVDLGVYYRRPLDVDGLRAVAGELAGPGAVLTTPGEWGPWVDGGGWLSIDGVAVDWLYRDLDRVHDAWRSAQQGRFAFHMQVGHPLGWLDVAYAGEVGLGVVLADPTGELAALHDAAQRVPEPLAAALVRRLGEAAFLLGAARKAARRGDATYVAGILFRTVGLCALALHAHARRWLINEKGAVAATGRLDGAPERFTERAHALLAHTGTTPDELHATLDAAEALLAAVVATTSG